MIGLFVTGCANKYREAQSLMQTEVNICKQLDSSDLQIESADATACINSAISKFSQVTPMPYIYTTFIAERTDALRKGRSGELTKEQVDIEIAKAMAKVQKAETEYQEQVNARKMQALQNWSKSLQENNQRQQQQQLKIPQTISCQTYGTMTNCTQYQY